MSEQAQQQAASMVATVLGVRSWKGEKGSWGGLT